VAAASGPTHFRYETPELRVVEVLFVEAFLPIQP
jgi:hypothetical protein